MALGEARQLGVGEQLVVVKAGTGVGPRLRRRRGRPARRQGLRGRDRPHPRARQRRHPLPLRQVRLPEAVAGGAALAERLTARRDPVRGHREVAALTRAGRAEAIAIVRQAGPRWASSSARWSTSSTRHGSSSPATSPNARDFLLSALRETVYREANTLATIELEISRARAGARAGLIGTATMALEHALTPSAIAAHAAVVPR